ncbi:MAG: hypothetical protein ACI9NY_000194 [Kiritimatiellia bacterium]|jgi:hypothetical protein
MRVLLCSVLLSLSAIVSAALQKTEIEQYVEVFQYGEFKEKRRVIKNVEFSGLSDPRLFDLIEESLLKNYLNENPKGKQTDYLSLMAKVLSFSGGGIFSCARKSFLWRRFKEVT